MFIKYQNGEKSIELDLPGVEDSNYKEVVAYIVGVLDPKFTPAEKLKPQDVQLPYKGTPLVNGLPYGGNTPSPDPNWKVGDADNSKFWGGFIPQPTGVARNAEGKTIAEVYPNIPLIDGFSPPPTGLTPEAKRFLDDNYKHLPGNVVKNSDGVVVGHEDDFDD